MVTEKEYGKRIAGGATTSLNVPAKGGVQTTAKAAKTNEWSRHTSEVKQIGRITGKGNEKRVTVSDEAVIGCQLTPISSLVKNPQLKQVLSAAVKKYSEDETKGSFIYNYQW